MFTLPSYKQLKSSLGEYDAVVQFQECARLTLMTKYEVAKQEKKIKFPDFITKESAMYGIHLHNLTTKEYPNIIFQSYLIMPNSLLEEFIDDFVDDYNSLFGVNIKLPNTKSKCKLEKLIELLSNEGILNCVQQQELDLYNYYRLIRNSFAHKLPLGNLSLASIDISYFKLKYPQFNAPNEPDTLRFDDFILFTATVKNIAYQITKSIESNINWLNFLKTNKNSFPKLVKLKGDRAITYVRNCISVKYGLTLSNEDINNSIGPFE